MCTLENVRVFVDQRLAAFAEEIFEVIERTMREYEEQLRRQQDLKLLTAAFQPQVRINRADVQLLTLSKEIPPEQQERTISLKQEEPPELPNIKEEEEEPWTEVTFTHLPVSVKVKDNHEDEPQPTQLHPRDHINDAVFDDDSGDGTGLDNNVNPEPDPDNCSSDWEDPVEHQSDLILQQNTQTPLDKEECSGGETFVESSDCPPSSDLQGNLQEGNQVQTEENPSTFGSKGRNLERNNKKQKSRPHLSSKRYTCLICNKTFTFRTHVEKHMVLHTGEKPLSCSLCGISFKTSARFEAHLQLHTGEGPFTCSPPNSDLQGNLQEGSQVQTEKNPSSFGSKGRNLERTHTEPSRTKDVQQLTLSKEVPPEQQERTISLKQEEPPELPNIKEEEEEPWTEVTFTHLPVSVKVKDNHEDEPQPTQLHPRDHVNDAVFDEDSSDGTGLDRSVNPEPDPDNCSSDWEDPVEHQSDLILQQNTQTPLDKEECSSGETSAGSPDCPPSSDLQGNLQEGSQVQTEENPSTFGSKGWNLESTHTEPSRTKDVQQLTLSKEVPPEQQKRTISLKQEEPPELPNIKEEEEEPWTEVTFTHLPVSVKVKDNHEDEPQPTQLHPRDHINDAVFDEDSGDGPGLDDVRRQHERRDSSDQESDDGSWDWEDPVERRSGLGSQVQTVKNPSSFGSKGWYLGRTFTELSRTKGEEQLGGLEEAQRVQFTWTPVSVKSEEDGKGLVQKPSGILMEGSMCSCPVCGKTFVNKERRRNHMVCHREKTFSCSICQKCFASNRYLKRHMVCHGEKPFSCSICKKALASKHSLKIHMDRHKEEKPFSCSVCKKALASRRSLKIHMNRHKEEKPFSCSVCKKALASRRSLKIHMNRHMEEKPFSCSVCKKEFASQDYLKEHMVCHNREKPFSCSFCKKTFKLQSFLSRHMFHHNEEKPFSCSFCKKTFPTPSQLRRHMVCHGEKTFSCSVCEKSFRCPFYLKQHMAWHKEERPFSCSVCRKPFPTQSHLRQHMICHNEKTFSCSICKMKFGNKYAVRAHMVCHKEEKQFSCSVCEKSFVSKLYLKQHMICHKEKTFSCSICPKKFRRKPALTAHMVCHMEKKPFSCSVCEKPFASKFSLKQHMAWHREERPFSCSVCRKRFPMKSHLRHHMICHKIRDDEEEKPFSCSICEKPFAKKCNLTRHMLCHQDEKPFSCSVCEKSFVSRLYLKQHMVCHSSERPFSCSICKKSFSRKFLMSRHMDGHRKEKPFSCSVCYKKFPTQFHLRRHMVRHKDEEPCSP